MPAPVITAPSLDAVVSGMVPIVGTAVHEAFTFYKLEYGAGRDAQQLVLF